MELLRKNANEVKVIANHFIKWFFLSAISGGVVGLVISLFLKSLQYATVTRENNPWIIYLLPFGGALVSYLYLKYGGDSSKGNNLIIERINNGGGYVPFKMTPLVFLGTFITHLFGGSAGREGTGVQIGASISSKLGRLINLKGMDHTILIISGVSSGFGVVFGTPIAGTVFGLEVSSIGKMRYDAIIPCLISSFIGNQIATLLKVQHTHYHMNGITDNPSIFYKVIFCAVIFGLVSKLFSELTHYLKKYFSEKIPNPCVKSFIGGILIIALVLILNTRIYLGLSLDLLGNSFEVKIIGYAFLLKLIFTSITLATGFQGGEVTPLFVIGATLGNFLSSIVNLPISFLSGLGMISVFCGATKTPLASFIMGVELFGAENIKYIFMACIISYVFSGKSGIYSSQENSIFK
ncbi:voltage-gated chloride channel family protein [Romboutsia sedimentorum]|uniref:Voltage-gated chloride channel family protein n=1 Tax=Romboutsia sedimentorum TaxID=1368474 RepID=A0ABT7EAS8_9FIRM|nr:voltage-gated chloride channel family protein [Romboutsia sedimentorum]MDK2564031.1 voltage-gated chloride channel family protein [Romboutsia sedimentorum]